MKEVKTDQSTAFRTIAETAESEQAKAFAKALAELAEVAKVANLRLKHGVTFTDANGGCICFAPSGIITIMANIKPNESETEPQTEPQANK